MPEQERLDVWRMIREDLVRARRCLPENVSKAPLIRQFQEFLDQNELGLACDAIEDIGEEMFQQAEFWLALHDAAVKMGKKDKAERYRQLAES
jgi:hypothetical protein